MFNFSLHVQMGFLLSALEFIALWRKIIEVFECVVNFRGISGKPNL